MDSSSLWLMAKTPATPHAKRPRTEAIRNWETPRELWVEKNGTLKLFRDLTIGVSIWVRNSAAKLEIPLR